MGGNARPFGPLLTAVARTRIGSPSPRNADAASRDPHVRSASGHGCIREIADEAPTSIRLRHAFGKSVVDSA
ncbi:hypothetical protein K8P10_002965 [Leucobacter sp. Psy1]|nr:hypothetical protein K8P10_002965 [Leucobacter sp. Psy1]